MKDRIVIGTRGSALALWQAEKVAAMLKEAHPDLLVELEVIETKGDKVLDVALSKIGDKGLFTKELENALFDRRADIAVHSLKDMQTLLPEGLTLACITERAEPEDALVARAGMTLDTLPEGARVATGSLRRRAQLLATRPDLKIEEVRGNVGTRLKRYREHGWDGMILARAGLVRLGLEGEIAEVIAPERMIPAVGQGALGIETREDDLETIELLGAIAHPPTRITSELERAFLRRLEGGCQAPIGAYATVTSPDDKNRVEITLTGFISSLDGATAMRDHITTTIDLDDPAPGLHGDELAEKMLDAGADEILAALDREEG